MTGICLNLFTNTFGICLFLLLIPFITNYSWLGANWSIVYKSSHFRITKISFRANKSKVSVFYSNMDVLLYQIVINAVSF